MDLRPIIMPRTAGQKILIQRKMNRTPVRLARTRTPIGTQHHYHTPHSVLNFFPSSLTIGSRAKKRFSQTRRDQYLGRPVLEKDVKTDLKQGALVLLQSPLTVRRLSHNPPVNISTFPSPRMAGLAD